MTAQQNISQEQIWQLLETVTDPEIPVLSIIDLGIVRNVIHTADSTEIIITPTYTGCPAMDMITMQIRMLLLENGLKNSKVTTVLSPAWTTDWMTETGKQKLVEYGIAAPQYAAAHARWPDAIVPCPQCTSTNTRLVSEFGSTACKALYQCNDCKEPFDYFKCH